MAPFASDEKPDGSIEDIVLKQYKCEPVARLGWRHNVIKKRSIANINVCQEEDKRRYQLNWYLLPKELNDLFAIPDHGFFIKHKSADEKEHGHANLYKKVLD